MSEQTTNQPDQESNTARVHRGSKLTAFQGKIKETNHIKKILAVSGAGVFLLVAVIIIHGPNKRHHDDPKAANVAQEAPSMDLRAYQQQVDAAQRRRETVERTQAVQQAGKGSQASNTGIMQAAPTDDPSDVSFIKQTWRQPQTWDDGQQHNNASAASASSSASRYRAQQPTPEDVQASQREQLLHERLDKIRARQAELLRQREEAPQ